MNQSFFYCTFTASGHQELSDFLKNNHKLFIKLSLVFHHIQTDEQSKIEYYENGKLIKSENLKTYKINKRRFILFKLILSYLIHILNIFTVSFKIRKYRIKKAMGLNYFCTFALILFKRISNISHITYYSADYYPRPPAGLYHYLISLFYFFDRICLNYSNHVWFINPKQYDERIKQKFIQNKNFTYDIVPVLLSSKDIAKENEITVQNQIVSICYVGVINDRQGLDLFLNVMKEMKNIPLHFHIFGSGPYETELKSKAEHLNLSHQVSFYGYVKDNQLIKKQFLSSSLGIALYQHDPYSHMTYGDSGKVKMYLSYSLPVLTTSVPLIAEDIVSKNCGYIVDFDYISIKQAINKYIQISPEKKTDMKTNSIRLAKKYTVENYRDIILREDL